MINFGSASGKVELSLSTKATLVVKWGLQEVESERIREELTVKIIRKDGLEQ